MRTLPRKNKDDIPETMFLRPQRPEDHREFNIVLPWLTPLFVYRMEDDDWVRWSIPQRMAREMGIETGCVCCGESTMVEGDNNDYHIDTSLKETDWWLIANQYAVPNPTEGR